MRHRACVFPRIFDPAALALQAWNRGSYSGSPWAGVASTGSSGSRSMTEATNPPAIGTSVDGFAPPDFNGTSSVLANATTFGNFVTQTSGTLIALFNADTAATDAGNTAPQSIPALISAAGGGYVHFGFSTSGVRFGLHNGTSLDSVAVACATGGWHAAFATWDSTTIYLAVDSGAFTSKAWMLDAAFSSGTYRIGSNYNGTKFFDGRIMEDMAAQFFCTTTIRDQIYSYFRARYPSMGLP